MSSNMSVEQVLAHLEQRLVSLREQESFHAQQEAHHREQRMLRAAELEKVQQSLESFRSVATTAVDLVASQAAPAAEPQEEELPPPGHLMVGRLLRMVIESSPLEEPFGPSAVAEEVNRRFADHLKKPVAPRTASDILRRVCSEGDIKLVRKGKASHEALYRRR
jgi:hypothetical protein